jgi:type II secretory pathway component GspD/PulD (secretin)
MLFKKFAVLMFVLFSCLLVFGVDQEDKKARKKIIITPEQKKTYKLIPLKTMDYQTVEDLCKPWLTEGGSINYEKRRNSILVYDTPEVIAKIRKFVSDVDQEAVNVRIVVDFMNTKTYQNDSLRMDVDSGLASHQKLVFKDGKLVKPKSYTFDGGINRGTSSNNNSQILMTRSGSPATLWVGKTILDPSWLRQVKIRPNIIIVTPTGSINIPGTDVDFKWAEIGSKLQVTPYYNENGTVTLEFCPVLSFLVGPKKHQDVKVESLATKLTVKDGTRVYIGGAVSNKKDVFTKLFGPEFYKNEGGTDILDMYLTATAIKPDGRRKNPGKTGKGENPWGMFGR